MEELNLTLAEYSKKISLGYYEQVDCISIFKKRVKSFKLSGGFDLIIINILKKNKNEKI